MTFHPKIDVRDYITQIQREFSDEKDLNSRLNVDYIKDPKKKKKASSSWLDSRISQLNIFEKIAVEKLRRAQSHGYLSREEVTNARLQCNEIFEERRSDANRRYNEAIDSLETISINHEDPNSPGYNPNKKGGNNPNPYIKY